MPEYNVELYRDERNAKLYSGVISNRTADPFSDHEEAIPVTTYTPSADDEEPSAEELAAIERESGLIEAELTLVDAEIRILSADDPSALDWQRLRRAVRNVIGETTRLHASEDEPEYTTSQFEEDHDVPGDAA